MLIIIFWLSSFLFFSCVGFLVLHRFYRDRMIVYRRLEPLLSVENGEEIIGREDELINRSLYARLIQPQFKRLRQIAEGKLPKNKLQQIEKRLHAAGNPFGIKAGDFFLLQILLPIIIFLVYCFLFLPTAENKGKVMVLAVVSSFLVYIYTNYYLSSKSKQRTNEIDRALPDFFDLLNVSIEAGMGLDGALKKVSAQMDSPLSREFSSALEDMKLGKSRRDAFLELRERVPSEFFKSVITSIIQADQMGLGMSKVLQTQSKRIREKQRFQVREQAMKAPVKMLLPMVFFIFPTLFIVLLGPIVINFIEQLT